MAIAIFTSLEQLTDDNGAILNGGSVTVYAATTTTPLSLFSDTGLSAGVTNPVTLNTSGYHAMTYIAATAYKILVKTAGGVTVNSWTRDNIDPGVPLGTGALAIANGGTGATSAANALTNLGAATVTSVSDLSATVAALSGAQASTAKTHIATGTTAQRDSVPALGDIRRNTTTNLWEWYDGATWEYFMTTSVTTLAARTAFTVPTIQRFITGTAATYTTPAGATWLRVKMIGGGGGGGAATANAGSNGTDSSFGTWTAVKGTGGGAGGSGTGGAGGTGGTDGTGTKITRIDGGAGGPGAATAGVLAGYAAESLFGGCGMPGGTTAAGGAAKVNTGSGGAGGANAGSSGGGGGAAEYVEFIISSPAASYTYTVGAFGAGGTAGTQAGGNGGAGIIIVEEHYET